MTFRALAARKTDDGYTVAFETFDEDALPSGERVTVDVAFSSLNYKDGLAVTAKGKIIRRFPMVLGIDLAGTVTDSDDPRFVPGDRVLGTGQGLGELEWGGYTQRQRVLPDALVPVPEGMSLEQSMQLGTAGLTAMLAVMALERNGVGPGGGEVVVTGAAGGVGSIAVMLLAELGYEVIAASRRATMTDYFAGLGASGTITPEELLSGKGPMQSERWGGAIDTVGGELLANIYAQTVYGGAVACCGMAASHELRATVWPLILRNVSLLGVSSLRTPLEQRKEAWGRLGREVDYHRLATLSALEPLSRIEQLGQAIVDGQVRGRVVLDVSR